MLRMTEMPATALVPEWTLGWRLQRALAHAEISTPDMADKLNVTRQTVRRWASDQIVPKPIYVKEWALICGVPYRWLAYGEMPTQNDGNRTSPQLSPVVNNPGCSNVTPLRLISRQSLTWQDAA
jgi:transcriptional regulator with XRE-family HTH domain